MEDFGSYLASAYTGAALTMLTSVGHNLGLFEAAAEGPATGAELAERTGLHERYVREWLGAMTTGRIFTYDPETRAYTLPAEHVRFLTGESAANAAPSAAMLRAFFGPLADLEDCFRNGGGIPHASFAPHFEAAGAVPGETWRRVYQDHLVDGFFAAVPGLNDRLKAGAALLDVGCGTGHAVNTAARAFPASTFHGLDQDPAAIARATSARTAPNARFSVADAAALPSEPRYDVITAFDAIHDQKSPEDVLHRIRGALSPDGLFLMVDAAFSSRLENNVGNPMAPLTYAISLLYCTTVSLAEGGAALGALWGTETALSLLSAAGFTRVEVAPSPRPQNCIYICTP
ncbi:class I SAM-dependent methyltransferase [Actinocorallia populi]|uniref:class I SAM-dependent methyltransferase n=1 Tax=Actinocorallia populi TaxID=2079200 RepID=UPI0018E59CCF|nr:class I SAM-dependent methyltransferase [Actinocorallia populi]